MIEEDIEKISSRVVRSVNERAGSDVNETSVKTVHEEVMVCNAHNRESCPECVRTAKKCHAMLASEWTLECGCKLPVIADACQVHNERMPVCIGTMGDQSVSVLRDTGCSPTVVVKRKLVDNEQMTGGTEICILIDGTSRRTPVAEIETKTPYNTGEVKAVCMKNPLYDVIIGNVPGVSNENNNRMEAQAAVTRAQAKQQAKPPKPLKVTENLGR